MTKILMTKWALFLGSVEGAGGWQVPAITRHRCCRCCCPMAINDNVPKHVRQTKTMTIKANRWSWAKSWRRSLSQRHQLESAWVTRALRQRGVAVQGAEVIWPSRRLPETSGDRSGAMSQVGAIFAFFFLLLTILAEIRAAATGTGIKSGFWFWLGYGIGWEMVHTIHTWWAGMSWPGWINRSR